MASRHHNVDACVDVDAYVGVGAGASQREGMEVARLPRPFVCPARPGSEYLIPAELNLDLQHLRTGNKI